MKLVHILDSCTVTLPTHAESEWRCCRKSHGQEKARSRGRGSRKRHHKEQETRDRFNTTTNTTLEYPAAKNSTKQQQNKEHRARDNST